MKRTGKIARLPHALREQLNQRLNDGEPGVALAAAHHRPQAQALPGLGRLLRKALKIRLNQTKSNHY